MQDNIFNAFTEQAKSFNPPFSKLNQLFVENTEKITELQLQALKTYTDLGINQLKKAAEIKDADSARAFTAVQAETATAINKKVMEDAKVFSDLAVEFKNEVETIMDEARATNTKKAEPKSTTKKTA